jgi:osmotically-inducible protein OsmY
MNWKRVAIVLVCAAMMPQLQGCFPMVAAGAVAAGAGAAALSAVDRRTTGTQVEDEGIELRASNRIGERYGDKVHVNVTSFNRGVLLTGEAPDEGTRLAIEKIVLGVPNVRGVTNEAAVAVASSLSSRSNDSFLTSKVKARFVDANRFNAVHVKVVTENSAVYLLGLVTQQEADAAVEIARTTGGVRKVVKVLDYCRVTDEACRPRDQPKAEPKKTGS